ncbi:hypothetical protein IMZ29_11605 [Achromobacter sp. GG226]|uniref:alpha/beta hydrolase domain-containing protein n=1 Tax=Verticiella alkaliphila TaxID=2779529 RepID=UPI001C0D5135|nr:alpha/beta hydrolase domain-containing protein [Verticiella sp. GG226]MBU4611154.1 hypothetical protein [Verticiella sp. GG226]
MGFGRFVPLVAFAWLAGCGGSDDTAPPPPQVSGPRMHLTVTQVSPVAGSWGTAGAYQRIDGRLTGEVDPAAPANAIITDLDLAQPRNARGMVEYTTEFVLFTPANAAAGNGVLRYDAPNRGNLLTLSGGLPDRMLLERGYSVLFSAWQGDVPKSSPARLTLDVPVARQANGDPVTGPYRAELVPQTRSADLPLPGGVFNGSMIPYAPVSLDNTRPGYSLTRRVRETDAREPIPASQWAFARCDAATPFPGTPDPTRVCLSGGFDPDGLYELVYEARDPKVMGVGLAALRDTVAFFRHASRDADGTPNPLAGHIRHALGQGTSQSGNFMKTFLHLGFNQDLEGRRVFDGIFAHVAARQTQVNARFAVPGGGGGLRTDHTAFGQSAPRGLATDYHDSISGRTGGILARCTQTSTCPRFFLGLSGTEFWVLQGSPVLTDAEGLADLVQPDTARIYYYASTQHGDGNVAFNPAQGRYPTGTEARFGDTFRALWVALEDWVVRDVAPPANAVPRLADGSLVRPADLQMPQIRGLRWSDGRQIPDVVYRGLHNDFERLDYGPQYRHADESGIATQLPPRQTGQHYAILVPQLDADGLDIAGIRDVGAAVPTGTSLGYNEVVGRPWEDLLGLSGSFLPFHTTRAARLAAGDSRPSLEERYGDHAGYVAAVQRAVDDLVARRLLLPADGERRVAEARAANVLR